MIADDRGRVPFAVVGVLLLVSSAIVATTVGPSSPPDDPAVDVVVDRVEAEQTTALRRAVREAASDAANDPVIDRANTTVGRALDGKNPFRDSLRLRAYVAARERLATVERRRGNVVATTTLPPVDADDAASVRAAIDRIELSAADENGTAVTASIRNVTTTVRRNGRVLDERTTSPRVTVATPVLALHDRVSAYQTRLDAGVTKPGLERRLTALLNAVGWARGYAQYHGAPIGNVVSNRHVEVATNAALLDVQQSTIGRVDRKGVRTLIEDFGRLSAQETLAMAPGSSPFLQRAVSEHDVTTANDIDGLDVPARSEEMVVGVNRTAEDAFLLMVREDTGDTGFVDYAERYGLSTVLEETYSAEVTLSTRTVDRSGGRPSPSPPGPGWERMESDLETSVSVSNAAPGGSVQAGGDWHALSTSARRVVTEYELSTTWANDGRRERTRTTGREAETIRISLLGRHASDVPGPDGPIRDVHEAGAGPLSGPNLAGVEDEARERLVGDRGGRDAVATAAAAGTLEPETVTVTGERPGDLREWVYRDLRDLRERVHDVDVEVSRRDAGSFAVNPPRLLRERLEQRRGQLLDASPPYDGVADRARVAARARYLDVVSRVLERRAESRANRRGALGKALDDADAGSIDDVQQSVHAAVDPPGAPRPALTGPGGPVRIRVDAAPAYLTLENVTADDYPAVDGKTAPLAARNVNLFALPYGEVVGGFLNAILSGPERTSLSAAAQTLRGRDRHGVPEAFDFRGSAVSYDTLVDAKTDAVVDDAVATLRRRGVGDDPAQRKVIVRDGLSRWNGTANEVVAIANGSAVGSIVAAAERRVDIGAVERDRLRLELDRSIRAALEKSRARPKSEAVEAVGEAVRSEAAGALRDAAERYGDRAVGTLTNGTASSLPSGLPLTPVPGYWYATTNVWHVEVHGEYARFGVRATRGRPSEPGAGLAYARDGGTVTLDVDGDGTAETLGRSTRVEFAATVDVVVVVPPGPQGVGDASGARDERSQGWPPDEE